MHKTNLHYTVLNMPVTQPIKLDRVIEMIQYNWARNNITSCE